MHKIGDYLIHKQSKQVFKITKVWAYPPHYEASNCSFIEHPQNQYFFVLSEIDRDYAVIDAYTYVAQLLYTNKGIKVVTNGKPKP